MDAGPLSLKPGDPVSLTNERWQWGAVRVVSVSADFKNVSIDLGGGLIVISQGIYIPGGIVDLTWVQENQYSCTIDGNPELLSVSSPKAPIE